MIIRKHLMATSRLVLLTIGLSLICGGAYIKSIQTDQLQMLRDVTTYILIFLGFTLLIVGVLWSIGHGMKNILVKCSERNIRNNEVHVFTVDSTAFSPPSYEECQVRNDVIPIPATLQWPDSAPPAYTENCCETCTEDYSHDEPPSYQQAILQCQSALQTTWLPTNSLVDHTEQQLSVDWPEREAHQVSKEVVEKAEV